MKYYALVAGGSKGIGFAVAAALARRGYNLVLVARHVTNLQSAKSLFESEYKITVEILVQDLSTPDAADKISDFILTKKIPLKILCNVAGLGGSRDFLKLSLDDTRYMVHLNLESYMAISYKLIPVLEKNAPSYILNVGSMAGFAPIPEKNMYSATKSAVIFFSYSLRYQLKKKKISVSCLCPGPVFTKPEIIKDTMEKLGAFGKMMAVEPAKVGEIAVSGLLAAKMIITPGALSSTMAFFLRILPRRILAFVYYKLGDK